MNWMQLALMIISLIRALKKSESGAAFAASAPAQKLQSRFNLGGDFLEKIWENREEILEFIIKLFGLFGETKDEKEAFAAVLGQDEN